MPNDRCYEEKEHQEKKNRNHGEGSNLNEEKVSVKWWYLSKYFMEKQAM